MKTFTRIMKQERQTLMNLNRKFIFLFAVLSFLSLRSIAQENSGRILFNQPTVSANQGTSFSLTVNLDMLSGEMDVVAIQLDFDPTKLNVTSVTNLCSGVLSDFVSGPTFNNTTGRVSFVAGTASAVTSDFPVISINFSVLPAAPLGTTQLTFRRANSPLTQVIRSSTDITSSVVNTTVTITSPGCAVNPTITLSNTSSCNGQPFDLILQNATGTGNWNFTINGTPYTNKAISNVITTYTPANESIWTSAAPASYSEEADPSGITLGVKFTPNVAGFIKGIRFFSRSAPSGTYSGQLWNTSGTLLASATFTSVTGGQWNQVLFTTPIQVASGVTYIASYYSSTGRYVATSNGLGSSATNGSGSLTALASGASSGLNGNGIYVYDFDPGRTPQDIGAGPHFPNSSFSGSFNNSNYWADVIFTPNVASFNITNITDATGCPGTTTNSNPYVVFSNQCTTLPITLINFSASPRNKDIILAWSTASEFNNKGFEIQRSIDNITWQNIGFVNGAGNSSSTKNYGYSDNNLFPHRYFYRLKQIDFDGNSKFSMIVSATIDGKAQFSLGQNYPNPFKGETTIQYTLAERTNVVLTIFDINGKVMKVLANSTKDAGTHAENFNSAQLSSGIYYYKIQAGDFTDVKKLIVQ